VYLYAGFGVDVVRFKLSKQRALVDAEAPRCGFSVALVSSQGIGDKKNLHLFQSFHLTDRRVIHAWVRTDGRR